MEKENIEPGNNVFIHVPKNHECHGSNGIVDSIVEQGVIVNFGPEFGRMFDGKYSRGITKMLFDPSLLKRFELKDHPKIRATRLYGRKWSRFLPLLHSLPLGTVCMHESCKEKSEELILFKMAHIVTELLVCKKHSHFDGKTSENIFFDMKLDYSEVYDWS